MYRKFKADQIFTGYGFLPASMVLISTENGEIVEIVDSADAGEQVEFFEGIISPGFINCHCHLELSHLKGIIPKKTGLVDFVFKIVTERHFAEAEIDAAIIIAENDMFKNGIVAVGDICNNSLTIPQKSKGNLWYRNFVETSGFPPGIAAERFQRSADIYNLFAAVLPNNSIVPHAPYSVSPALFKMINDFYGNDFLSIHNQEIAAENELFKNKTGDFLRMFQNMNIDISFFNPTGKSSLQTFLPGIKNKQSLLLVHNVSTTADDLVWANAIATDQQLKLFYCLCPNANLYISDLLPDLNIFLQHNCFMVLGTDSLASNDQLSILEEIKTLHKNFPSVEINNLLQWATINGAIALGCDETYGSFEKGKRPGIVSISGLNEKNGSGAVAKRLL